MKLQKEKMPKAYAIMWCIFTAAYAIWMVFFMKNLVLNNYESVETRTMDGIVLICYKMLICGQLLNLKQRLIMH